MAVLDEFITLTDQVLDIYNQSAFVRSTQMKPFANELDFRVADQMSVNSSKDLTACLMIVVELEVLYDLLFGPGFLEKVLAEI